MIRNKLNAYWIIVSIYFLSLINLIDRLGSYSSTNYQAVATSKSYMYGWIPDDVDINAWLSFVAPALMTLLIVAFPFVRYQTVRIGWFFACYLIEGFRFAYILGHSSHALVWFALILAVIPGDLNSRSEKQESDLEGYVRLCQLQIFLIYGSAGVWKIFGFFEGLRDSSIASGFDYVQYAMASEFMYSNRLFASAEWVSDHVFLCFFFSALVVVVQAGSIFVAFLPRLYMVWGLILAIFHVGTLFTVNVFFYWSIPPIVLLLTLYPMSHLGVFEPIARIKTRPEFDQAPRCS